uniref:E3 ubiquitin-protein ligase n=1 Tax=Schistocephalus solidus TaxID=70667 RepID=A0A183TCW0_SCHSO
LPASLKDLYRLIDLFKSIRGGLWNAKSGICKAETISSERLSELQAHLTKVFRTCRSAFTRRETQLTLPTLIQPASKSLRISTALRVLGRRLAVLSRDSRPDTIWKILCPVANSSFKNPVETGRYPDLQQAIHDFYLGIHNCFAQLRDFAHFAGLDIDDIWSKDSANETTTTPLSVFPPDSVTRCRQWVSDFRASVERTQPLGLRAVWLAACEWRALRHTVAYTLVVWERYLRHLSPATNFFNEGLSDYYKTSLGYLLRATFQAHARLAPVSRGCRPACQDSDDETGQCAHADCWLQRRNDPDWWWWYSYFSPAPSEAADSGCCRDAACMASDLLEPVTRVAVTQDAARLWRLLLPEYHRQGVSTTCETVDGRASTEVVNDFSPSTVRQTSSPSINDGTSECREEYFTTPYLSASVLWEVGFFYTLVLTLCTLFRNWISFMRHYFNCFRKETRSLDQELYYHEIVSTLALEISDEADSSANVSLTMRAFYDGLTAGLANRSHQKLAYFYLNFGDVDRIGFMDSISSFHYSSLGRSVLDEVFEASIGIAEDMGLKKVGVITQPCFTANVSDKGLFSVTRAIMLWWNKRTICVNRSGHPNFCTNFQSPSRFTVPKALSDPYTTDITFLFVNLLFLRPGLEEESAAVECQRLQSLRTMGTSEADSDATDEGVDRRSETPPLAACDEGFPRLPIGDSHEAFLLRLCYLALLVQALLSWQGNEKELDVTKSDQQESVYSEVDPHVSLWLINKLLTVRGRLLLLCGLSDCDSPPTASSVSEETGVATTAALKSLFAYLRCACLPFLRIAAFILQEITNIESIDEFIVLLAYLGLPLGPEDLLAVLSVDCDLDDANEEHSVKSQRNDSSSSLCLARLITSWCLVGRSSHSRNLYSRLRQQFTPQITVTPPLLPEPQICVPHLIRLPREHVSLLALVAEWKNEHPQTSASSYPSVCLVCGTVASFLYPNSQQSVALGFDLPSTFRLEHHSCDMQTHVGRNHAGYAFILVLQMGNLLLSDHARQITKFPELYRDEFGEPDTHLRRGCPLFLDEAAYRRLNETWLKHEAIQSAPNEHPEASAPSYPSLCLVCGTVASFLYPKSQQSVPLGFDLPSTFRLERHICDMQTHVGRNHAGYAFILLLQMGNLLLLSDHARQITKFPELYRDEFGEPETILRYELLMRPKGDRKINSSGFLLR